MDPDILFSIVIPVKNGDQWLTRLLDKLVRQTLFSKSEIIVIDSGSTDHSLEIFRRYPIRLIQIPSSEFNHGATRNLGARAAKGEFVVMTVQDAVPAGDDWLELLLSGFRDERVAGVCGQQAVPHERDKNPALWFRPISGHRSWFRQYDDPADFLKLSPAEQREIIAWDNVTAAYRRRVLLEHPFPAVDFAEDLSWAKMMLLNGYTLGFVSGAIVYHYHHQTPKFILPRYFSVFFYEFELFGMRPSLRHSVGWHVLVAGKTLLKEPALNWAEKTRWLLFNIRYWLVLRRTVRRFNRAATKGRAALEEEYREICKRPPQAIKYK